MDGSRLRFGIDVSTRIGARLASIVELGAGDGQPPRLAKAIRLCNASAFAALVIMVVWAVLECGMGDHRNVFWEAALVLGFAACLILNGFGWHRAGRLGLLVVADIAVFMGAVLFLPGSGGTLPFIAMIGLPFLLFRPTELRSLVIAIGTAVALFALCETGLAALLLHISQRTAPPWYFGANALTAFAVSLLVPFIFYRGSLETETQLERLGTEKLKRLIDADIIGVARGIRGGPVRDANDAFLNLLGYTREDLAAGRIDLGACTPPEYAEVTRRAFAALERDGACQVYEKEYLRKDGSRVPVLVGMSTLDHAKREVVGFVLDITFRKELEWQRRTLQEKDEAVRVRDLFASMVSHELKTPLAALLLLIERASAAVDHDGSRNEEALRLLRKSQSSVKRLAVMVDDLLDMSRASRGKLELVVQPMDLAQAVREVVANYEAGGVVPPSLIALRASKPITGIWDPMRIEQVITNLVSNAIKYGGGRPIEIVVDEENLDGQASAAEHSPLARLEVVDHGLGIEQEMIEKIFDPFQRAASSKRIQGLGLGLFVVKSIVEAHGGTIRVTSQLDCGSQFVVDLPRIAADG